MVQSTQPSVSRTFVRRGGILAVVVAMGIVAPARAADAESSSPVGAFFKALVRVVAPTDSNSGRSPVVEVEGPAAKTEFIGTHQQTKSIPVNGGASGELNLASFCLDGQGHLVTLVTAGAGPHILPSAANELPPGEKLVSEVQIRNAVGEIESRFAVPFLASAINVADDGKIYVGGDGQVAAFDSAGQLLLQGQAPHLQMLKESNEELEARARATIEEQAESIKNALSQLQTQYDALADKAPEDLSNDERLIKESFPETKKIYEQMIAEQGSVTPERIQQTSRSLTSRQRSIHAISVNSQHVFVTCAATKGYGYAVWRIDRKFENPALIVDGLRGCCGQMDVQCCGDEIVVAENSRHRVVRFDVDGKQTIQFGKRGRDGEGAEFGGCCNPMNTRRVGDKLYVAESDGTIKLFSVDGEFIENVGRAAVEPGCKSSIVAASSDGQYVYYFDVNRSAICLLERQAVVAQVR